MMVSCTDIHQKRTESQYDTTSFSTKSNNMVQVLCDGTYWDDKDSLMTRMFLSQDGDEKLRLCQIDQRDLPVMSTEELVAACYYYPLAYDIYLNEDEKYATDFYIKHFNGFTELLSRKDAIDKMIQWYASLNLDNDSSPLRDAYYERVLTNDSFQERMNEQNKSDILKIATDKNAKGSPIVSPTLYKCRRDLIAKLRNSPEPYPDEPGFIPQYDTITMRTPFGKAVNCSVLTNEEDPYIIDSLQQYIIDHYDNILIIGPATYAYNCHAYAWLSSNSVWMNENQLSKFYTDDYYISCVEEAYSVIYYGGNHSAKHYQNYVNFYCSKWGPYQLIVHTPTNVPPSYQPSNRNYYKRIPFSITGPDTYEIGTEYTYTVTPLLSYALYDWEIEQNSNSYQIISQNKNVLKVKFLNNNFFYNITCNVCDSTGVWLVKTLEYETIYTP